MVSTEIYWNHLFFYSSYSGIRELLPKFTQITTLIGNKLNTFF